MVISVNNGFVFSFQKVENALISVELDEGVLKRILAFAYRESVHDFKECALVCKSWNVLGKKFYQELYQRIAPHLFGKADYLKYIGGDPGPEFPIPLDYLVKFRLGETLLTFAPKELTFTQADGTVVVEPCTMVNMGKWALNAKEGHPSGYNFYSWQEAIAEERELEDSHWSFINIELIEKKKTFAEQENAVLARREALVGLSDLSLSLLMTHVKTGVRYLYSGETNTNFQFARVPETTRGYRLSVSFATAGLLVRINHGNALGTIGVIVARKSFGQ